MAGYLLLITYHTKPGCKQMFVDEVSQAGILSFIQQEEGCRRYQYFFPADQDDVILLVEEWESELHQKKHMKQPHMAELMCLKEKYILETNLSVIKIAE